MDTTSSGTDGTKSKPISHSKADTEDVKLPVDGNTEQRKEKTMNITEIGDGDSSHIHDETERQKDEPEQPVTSVESAAHVQACTEESATQSVVEATSDQKPSVDSSGDDLNDGATVIKPVDAEEVTSSINAEADMLEPVVQEDYSASDTVPKQEDGENTMVASCVAAGNEVTGSSPTGSTEIVEAAMISECSVDKLETDILGNIIDDSEQENVHADDNAVIKNTDTIPCVTTENEETGSSTAASTEVAETARISECSAGKMEQDTSGTITNIDITTGNDVPNALPTTEPISAAPELVTQQLSNNQTAAYEAMQELQEKTNNSGTDTAGPDVIADILTSGSDKHTEIQAEINTGEKDEDVLESAVVTAAVIPSIDKTEQTITDVVEESMDMDMEEETEDAVLKIKGAEQKTEVNADEHKIEDTKTGKVKEVVADEESEIGQDHGETEGDKIEYETSKKVAEDVTTAELATEEETAIDTNEEEIEGINKTEENEPAEDDTREKIEDTVMETNPDDAIRDMQNVIDPAEGDTRDTIENTAETVTSTQAEGVDTESRVDVMIDESSRNEITESTEENGEPAKKKQRQGSKESILEDEEEQDDSFPASRLFEYQWPAEKGGDWYMIQEQLSEFLAVVSFKRRYPDLQRRPLELNERIYLLENGIVTEMQCDLGLTALKMDQVHELMARDYPDKFQEYAVVLRKREEQRIADHHKGYEMPQIEGNKIDAFVKNAVKSAAEFNALFMKEKRDERKAYIDLQTNVIHYPQRPKKFGPHLPVGAYPVALIPGQFQDYYKSYTAQELKYLPLSTALYSAPRPLKTVFADPNQPSEEDTEDEERKGGEGKTTAGGGGGERNSDGTSSGSSSTSGSTSGSENESEAEKSADSVAETPATKGTNFQNNKRLRNSVRKSPWLSDSVPSLVGVKKETPSCNICKNGCEKNRTGEPEDLVTCSECARSAHPSCLELTTEMIPTIRTYPWQCMDCKMCNKCMAPHDEDKMMFCDHCDRGYHSYCVGVRNIPTGRWDCPSCQNDTPRPKRTRRR